MLPVTARAHALDRQTSEMEAGNLLSEPPKRISEGAVRRRYSLAYSLFYNSLAPE